MLDYRFEALYSGDYFLLSMTNLIGDDIPIKYSLLEVADVPRSQKIVDVEFRIIPTKYK
jgi:hypothetical protein